MFEWVLAGVLFYCANNKTEFPVELRNGCEFEALECFQVQCQLQLQFQLQLPFALLRLLQFGRASETG